MDLYDRVRQLIDAENEASQAKAEPVLASDFVAITMWRGLEQRREALLNSIANPPNPNPRRELDQLHKWESMDIGVVRSRVTTKDPRTEEITGEYRNLHVFRKDGNEWMCVDWQVTKLERT